MHGFNGKLLQGGKVMDSQMDLALISYAKSELSQDELRQFMMLMPSRQKNTSTGILLALLLGGFGAHKFYFNKPGEGVAYLLCGTIGWFIVIPPIIIGIACIVDACQMSNTVRTANTSAGRSLVQELITIR